MKNTIRKTLFTGLLIPLLVLSACQGSKATAEAVEPVQSAAQVTQAIVADEITTQTTENSTLDAFQLLFGILKLAGTEQEITSEQAAALLPLWTNYQTLVNSMNPGPNGGPNSGNMSDQASTPVSPQGTPSAPQDGGEEKQDQTKEIVEQIQALMTSDQISAIQALQLVEDQDSLQTLYEELGITVENMPQMGEGSQPQGGGPGGGGNPPEQNGTMTPPDNSGSAPTGGNPPDMGSGTPAAGSQPDNGGKPGGTRIDSAALQALIDYLTSKSA